MISAAKRKSASFAPVDLTGNAHVGLYERDPKYSRVLELSDPGTLVYWAPIELEITTAQLNPVWAMVNLTANAKSIYLRRLLIGVAYTGSAVGNSYQSINLERVTGTTVTISGAANIAPVKRTSAQGASILGAADLEQTTTGVTPVTVSGGTLTVRVSQSAVPIGVTSEIVVWEQNWCPGFYQHAMPRLAPNQAFQIRTSNSKASCTGYIEWEERI